MIFIYIIAFIISWIIFYFVVKWAVINGINEARAGKNYETTSVSHKVEQAPNEDQKKLQEKYDKGLISFEVYKTEWENLKR